MTETINLEQEEERLEEEARGLTIRRFHKEHLEATLDGSFSETFMGSRLVKSYLVPYSDGIVAFVEKANSGGVGRRLTAARLLENHDPMMMSFLMLKAIINKVPTYHKGKRCSFTGLALAGAGLIHDELRLRAFEDANQRWSDLIHKDFASRELPRYKRLEYMQSVFRKAELEWNAWTKSEKMQVGSALLNIFRETTGDISLEMAGGGKHQRYVVIPSEALVEFIEEASESCEAIMTSRFPMVVPPTDWSADNLNVGGYLTPHVSPYPLVKNAKAPAKAAIKAAADAGELDDVLASINAIQSTPWAINTRVLEVLEEVYRLNIPCGKLPRSDRVEPDPPPQDLKDLPRDDPRVRDYLVYAFKIHEGNRRVVGKRVMASRAMHIARKFSKYPALYFPHDLDSRGRAYPVPAGLNPQGPDYVKALLQFARGKALGKDGLFWLAVHGANCWGHDKLLMDERAEWGASNRHLAESVAADPLGDRRWTDAEHPFQFLAWCFDFAAAHRGNPEEHVSFLHVDLDATCSGLQHFAAMLRDGVGGRYVNMTPSPIRHDVYQAVADATTKIIRKDLGGDRDTLARAWLEFGVSRKITKRSVMVKPYAGTRNSCLTYVAEAVDEELASGKPLPVPDELLKEFRLYGGERVWDAIPTVVVAAEGALMWLKKVTSLVARSLHPTKRIEWVTPLGLPVHQHKFELSGRRVKTFFDGKIIRPRLVEEEDKLAPRQMANSVAPSFVHSLDAAHMQATIRTATKCGLRDFAVVHDSFGVHAGDIPMFSRIIREEFVEMYEGHDVLQEFLDCAEPYIRDDLKKHIPPIPPSGALDLRGVIENEFFFS